MTETSKKLKSLVIASILGDGYLSKQRNRGNYLEIQHSNKQLEYLKWKKKRFQEEGISCNIYDLPKYKASKIQLYGGKFNGINLRHSLYPNNNKTISRRFLNMLDEEGLAIWFMDDGGVCFSKRKGGQISGRYLKISTYCFNYAEHIILQRYFRNVWGINPQIKMDKGKYYWLKFNATEANKLIPIIRPYIHPTLQYKIDLKYKERLRSNEQPRNRLIV